MNKKKIQIILSLFLIALFPLTITLTFQATGSQSEILFPNITTSSVGNFVEDFTTDVFKDPATTAWGWGTGTVTNSRNFSWNLLDYFPTSDPATGLAVQGRKAYVTCLNMTNWESDFRILNINDPKDIEQTDIYGGWSGSMTVEVDGDLAYVGKIPAVTPINYIITYNVEDPFSISYIGSELPDGEVTDIDPEGHFVYFTSYGSASNRSFNILYAEDPYNRELLQINWNTNLTLGIDVEGDTAYVAASTDGFYTLDLADKTNPVELGHIALPGNATDVIFDGAYVYLAAGDAGIYIINVRDPTNPIIKGHCDTPGYAHRIVQQGRTLFVADGNGGVQVLDIYDPNHPTIVTQMNSLPYTWDVDLYGGDLVVATDDGIYTYRIGYITKLESFYTNIYDDHEVWDVRVRRDIAYIAGGPDGLITLNVADPNNPILLDNDAQGSSPFYRKLEIQGDYAYVVEYGGYVRIYNISDPTDIVQTDSLLFTYLTDIAISGDVAFLADGPAGVYTYNVSDPTNMFFIDSFDDGFTNITSVWVQGRHLYIVDDLGGAFGNCFYIYDISDISAPVQVGVDDLTSYCYDVNVDGDVAYVADGNWLCLYNVSDPANEIYIHSVYTDHYIDSYGVWPFGPYVLSASGSEGVFLVNETDYSNENVYNCPNATAAIQIHVSGDYTYVANRSSLVILRHFESAADTYVAGTSIAQSLEVDGIEGIIHEATLDFDAKIPDGSAVEFFLSADSGANWELVTPGTPHTFANPGGELLWKAEIHGPEDRSVHLYEVTIDFDYNAAPTIPELSDPGTTNFAGIAKLTWNESTDDVIVDHYIVQMSDTNAFGNLLKNVTTTTNSKSFSFLSKGTYYFRVLAVDDTDLVSAWSNVEDLEITFGLLSPMWLGIFGGALVLIIVLVVVISVVVRRKKKIATR